MQETSTDFPTARGSSASIAEPAASTPKASHERCRAARDERLLQLAPLKDLKEGLLAGLDARLREVVTCLRDDFGLAVCEAITELRGVLKKEAALLRQGWDGDAARVLEELGRLREAFKDAGQRQSAADLSSIVKEIRNLSGGLDHSPVIAEIRKVRTDVDISAVLSEIRKVKNEVDFSQVLREIRRLGVDMEPSGVVEKLRRLHTIEASGIDRLNTAEVSGELRKIDFSFQRTVEDHRVNGIQHHGIDL